MLTRHQRPQDRACVRAARDQEAPIDLSRLVRGTARRARRLLSPAAARTAGPGSGPTAPPAQRSPGAREPIVSVVVVLRGGAPHRERRAEHLRDCLQSVLRQTHRALEVVLVSDGSPEAESAAADWRRRDRRVLTTVGLGGPGAARNAGVAVATGAYLAFVEPEDTLPRVAIATLVRSLTATGSDFAVGALRTFADGDRRRTPAWVADLHRAERLGVVVGDVPAVLRNASVTNRLFERTFFVRDVGEFAAAGAYEDQVPSARAYLRGRFDVLNAGVYHRRIDTSAGARTAQRTDPTDLADRLAATTAVADLMRREAATEVAEAWLAEAVGADLRPWFEQVARSDAGFWTRLRAGVLPLIARIDVAGPGVWRRVPIIDRYPALCVREDRRGDLVRWLTLRDTYGGTVPTVVVGARVELDPAHLDGFSYRPPAELTTLAEDDLRLVSRLTDWQVTGPGSRRLRLVGSAYVSNVSDDLGLDVTAAAVAGDRRVPLTLVRRRDHHVDVDARDPWHSHAGAGFAADLDLDALPDAAAGEAEAWTIELSVRGGPITRTGPFQTAETAGAIAEAPSDSGGWHVAWDRGRGVQIERRPTDRSDRPEPSETPGSPATVVHGAELDAGVLRLVARRSGAAGPVTGAALVGARDEIVAAVVHGDDHELTIEVDLTAAGPVDRRAPYELRIDAGSGSDQRATADRALFAEPVRDQRTATHAFTLSRDAHSTLRIRFRPPLGPQERSRRAAHLLQQTFRTSTPLRPVAVFESFTGRSVTDSPAAICAELLTRNTGLEICCAVDDLTRPIPAGATPLLIGSHVWFETLHAAEFIVNNANLPYWFRKQPGQTYVQTWHGTPLKRIGNDVPSISLSLPYRDLMTREPGYWDLLLAQNDFAARVLPRAFGYDGEVLTVGYPRNDSLAAAPAGRRDAVRAALGLRPDQFAVLYAPTWRDTTRSERGYTFVRHLDAGAVRAGLGPDAVVLLRGHANVYDDHDAATEGVVDVTGHPEVNDLFLAADALVTDYSSVMFDFCVTGKPMAFLAPDIAEYGGRTRGFYLDVEATVPGPVCATSDEVVAALADPSLRERYAERYAVFRATYAPMDDGQAARRVVDHVWGPGSARVD